MKYRPCNYPLKIFILLNCFWAHLNCFPSAQRGCLRGGDWYSTKRVNLTNETLPESSMQMRFISSFIVSNSKCCMAAPLIRAKASCWINTLSSIPVASFLSKIHTLEELSSQCYSLSDAAWRNRALAENTESCCSLLTSESQSGFQMLHLQTLLTIWKFLKGF